MQSHRFTRQVDCAGVDRDTGDSTCRYWTARVGLLYYNYNGLRIAILVRVIRLRATYGSRTICESYRTKESYRVIQSIKPNLKQGRLYRGKSTALYSSGPRAVTDTLYPPVGASKLDDLIPAALRVRAAAAGP